MKKEESNNEKRKILESWLTFSSIPPKPSVSTNRTFVSSFSESEGSTPGHNHKPYIKLQKNSIKLL